MAAPQLVVRDETLQARESAADAERMARSKRDFEMMASARLAGAVMASDAGADHRTGGGYAPTIRKPQSAPRVTMPRIMLGRWAMDAVYISPFPIDYMRSDSIFFSE